MKTTKAFFEIERQDGPRTFDGQFSHLKVHILVPQWANAGKPVVQTGLWSLTNRKVETRSVELLLRSPEEEAKAAAEAAAKEVEVAA